MADIYSHMPRARPVFTSKSMPFSSPLGHQPPQHHLHSPTPVPAHSSIHGQLPNLPSSLTTPQRPSLKRARSDDEDDAMDGSPTPTDKRVLTSAKGRKLAHMKRLRVETISGESPGRTRPKGAEEKTEDETAEDEVDAGVLLGMSISRFPLVVSLLIVGVARMSSFQPASLHPLTSLFYKLFSLKCLISSLHYSLSYLGPPPKRHVMPFLMQSRSYERPFRTVPHSRHRPLLPLRYREHQLVPPATVLVSGLPSVLPLHLRQISPREPHLYDLRPLRNNVTPTFSTVSALPYKRSPPP